MDNGGVMQMQPKNKYELLGFETRINWLSKIR